MTPAGLVSVDVPDLRPEHDRVANEVGHVGMPALTDPLRIARRILRGRDRRLTFGIADDDLVTPEDRVTAHAALPDQLDKLRPHRLMPAIVLVAGIRLQTQPEAHS